MDNEYFTAWIIRERLRDLQAAARRDALVRNTPSRRTGLRIAVGTLLIRLGAWLSSERADATALVPPRR